MMVIEGRDHAIQMGCCCNEHKDMEDLVRAAPDVERTWILAFREPDLCLCQ